MLASEAKEIAAKVEEGRISKILDEIHRAIRHYAGKGKRCLRYTIHDKPILVQLEKNGYRVERIQNSDDWWIIWDD